MRLFVLLLYAIFLVVDYVHFTPMLTGYRLYIQSSNLPLMRFFFFQVILCNMQCNNTPTK